MALLTRGAKERTVPWKAKCKNWAPTYFIFDISTLLVFSRLFFTSFVVFSGDFEFQHSHPYPDSLLHIFSSPSVASGPRSVIFCPLTKISISAVGWGIRWKRSGLVHCARSETVCSKWLSHCQVFWAGEEVDERICIQQACLMLFEFWSSWLQNEHSRQTVKS